MQKCFRFVNPIWVLLFFLGISSCKKNDSGWETDFIAPIAKTRLNFSNLINDTLLSANDEGFLSIRFKRNFALIPLDSLINLPDTTIAQNLSIPFPIQIPPGFSIFSQNQELVYNLGDIRITEIIVESGLCEISVKSIIPRNVIFNYSVPKASFNGQIIELTNQLLTAFAGDTVMLYRAYDLAWNYFDFTSDDGNSFNRLRLLIEAKIAPNDQAFTPVANQVLIKLENTFSAVKPYFARGYFGNRVFDNQSSVNEISELKNIEGILKLDQVNLNLTIENGVGADIRFKINELKGFNSRNNQTITLQNSLIGQNVNIGRALNQPNGTAGLPFTSVTQNFILNNSNSNITNFFENLPDELSVSIDAKVNPLGNVSNGNDFIYSQSNVNMLFDLDIPLKFSASELSFSDTLDFNFNNTDQIDRIKSAKLILIANNRFPLELSPEIYLLDENNQLLETIYSEQKINAATVNMNLETEQAQKSVVIFDIPEAKRAALNETKKIRVKLKINSKPDDTLVPFYSHYYVDLQIAADFSYFIQP